MASSKFSEPYVISPTSGHTHTIILLHGRGDNGRNFAWSILSDSPISRIPSYSNCKWIFPSAPERWSTVFKGNIPEWYDLYSTSDPESNIELQVEGLKESVQWVDSMIQEELQRIPARNIILVGISQGFAVAAHVLLTSPQALGGFCGMSGWIPYKSELQELVEGGKSLSDFYSKTLGIDVVAPGAHSTRCLVTHSKDDPTIDHTLGISACTLLRSFGFPVDMRLYLLGRHWLLRPDGYEDVASFLQSCINEPAERTLSE